MRVGGMGIGPTREVLEVPKRRAREALVCLAGEGGVKGRLRNLREGVGLAGEGETPAGRGLVPPGPPP